MDLTDIALGLLFLAFLVAEGPRLWAWVKARWPKPSSRAEHLASRAENIVRTNIEPELAKDATMISDLVQQKLAQLGAAIAAYKTRAEAAEKTLADRDRKSVV